MKRKGAATSVAEKKSHINATEVASPKGYKQTKVGVIPEDWEEYRLKDVLNLTLKPLKMEDEKEYELITVRRRFGGVDSRGLFKGKEILVKNQFYVRENNFVISKRQISHGACGLVPKELDGAIVSNEYNVFQPNIELLIQEFFNYYVRLPKFSQTFYNYSDGVHIEKLLFKTQSWLKQKIPFPPLKEQQEIAQILTTGDKAISKQEALLVEKEQLKKGLMQKLLSGEIRFGAATSVAEDNATEVASPEWEEVRLGEVATFHKGKGISKNDISDDGISCIRYGELYTKYNERVEEIISKTSIEKENLFLSEVNDILIPASGETAIDLATASCVLKKDIGLGGDINVIRTHHNGIFLSYYLNIVAKTKIASMAQGVSVIHLYASQLKSLKIKLPSKQEQQKIAQVLTTADKEIELLKKELEALKEQKRGLMQRLLTGEVRVKI